MILYSKFNTERKKCFQLVTKIQENDNVLFSSKNSTNFESKKFLNSFYDKYDILIKNNFSITPVKPQKINDAEISFEFQNLPTFERLLLISLKTKNKREFVSLINAYIQLIKNNKIKIEFVNSNFKKIFGSYGTKNKKECLQLGCLDLNFDNIIVDKTKREYKLIDYEWIFNEVTIPYKYIVFRAIYSFYDSFSCYYPNIFYSFKKILKLLDISLQEQKEFISYEYNFQCYVYGNKFTKNTKIEDYNNYYLQKKFFLNQNSIYVNILNQTENQDLNKPKIKINEEKNELNQKLIKFQSSSIFKIWELCDHFKNKFSNLFLSKFS